MKKILPLITLINLICLFNLKTQVNCQLGTVTSYVKISDTQGNFTGILDDADYFGSVSFIGDVNNDGIIDIAAGAVYDDDGGNNKGAVWILFLNSDGTVKSYQKISDTEGNFTGDIDELSMFGCSIAPLGDFDNNGTPDIIVGAYRDNDGGVNSGAVWLLFLNPDGTVLTHQKISATQGGLSGLIANRLFGINSSPLGDLDNDGTTDIVVGAPNFDYGSSLYSGSVWILFLNPDGTVKNQQIISDFYGNFSYNLHENDQFGWNVSSLDDLNNDGVTDIAVSAPYDDDGGQNKGAIYILFLNSDGTVKADQKISDLYGNFNGILDDNDSFSDIAQLNDLNGDGINDIIVGAPGDDDGADNSGAIWILFLNIDGTVKSYQKISTTEGNFSGIINGSGFGMYVCELGDLTNNGTIDIAVSAPYDDDGGENRGAVWILSLFTNETILSISQNPKDTTIFENNDALFYISNTGLDVIYQWQINQGDIWIDINDENIFTGTDNDTLFLTSVSSDYDNTKFRCIITNACGSDTSETAKITLLAPTEIITDPTDVSICNNSNTYFNIAATGSVISYQWQMNVNDLWENVLDTGIFAGATNDTLRLSQANIEFDSTQFRCIAYNYFSSDTSSMAFLYIITSPEIISEPNNTSICIGQNTFFTIKVKDIAGVYQWQINEDDTWTNIVDGGIFSGTTDDTLILSSVTSDYENAQFRCIFYNYCSSDTSETALLQFNNCHVFSGEVYAGKDLLHEGIVELINVNNLNSAYSTFVDEGWFLFNFVKEENYYIFSTPGGSEADEYFPTYFYDSKTLEDAIPINVTGNVSEVKIKLVSKSTNINDFNYLVNMKIYPNPAKGSFIIEMNNQETIKQIKIYDMVGIAICEADFVNSNIFSIDLSGHPKGLYLIKTETMENVYSNKILVE